MSWESSRVIVDQFQTIAFEDLTVKGLCLTRMHHVNSGELLQHICKKGSGPVARW